MKRALLILIGLAAAYSASSQIVGIRTNILSDISTTLNLAAEVGLGPQISLDVPVSYNPWKFGGGKMFKQIAVQPEVRWWTKQRFAGHFVGFHLHYASYNFSNVKLPFNVYPAVRDNRFEGQLYGFGFSYGYQWKFNDHWGIEGTIGLGYARIAYDKYPSCCGDKIGSGHKNYWGPTRLGINLIYYIR